VISRSIFIAVVVVAALGVTAVMLGGTERAGDVKDDVVQFLPSGDEENEREDDGDRRDDEGSKAEENENENKNENEPNEQQLPENEQETEPNEQGDAAGPLAHVSGDGGNEGDDDDNDGPIDCSIPDNADDSGCDTEDTDDRGGDSGDSDDSDDSGTVKPRSADSDTATPRGGVQTGAGGASPLVDPVDDGVFDVINRVRRSHGLRPLNRSVRLDRAATGRSRDMAHRGYFSHTIPGTGWFSERVLPAYKPPGFRTWRLGENLFYSVLPKPSSYVVRAWMNSAPHRYVLLRPFWNDVGIGVVRATSAPGIFGRRPVTIVTAEFGMLAR
jgi:uncharacterized protein YkwD